MGFLQLPSEIHGRIFYYLDGELLLTLWNVYNHQLQTRILQETSVFSLSWAGIGYHPIPPILHKLKNLRSIMLYPVDGANFDPNARLSDFPSTIRRLDLSMECKGILNIPSNNSSQNLPCFSFASHFTQLTTLKFFSSTLPPIEIWSEMPDSLTYLVARYHANNTYHTPPKFPPNLNTLQWSYRVTNAVITQPDWKFPSCLTRLSISSESMVPLIKLLPKELKSLKLGRYPAPQGVAETHEDAFTLLPPGLTELQMAVPTLDPLVDLNKLPKSITDLQLYGQKCKLTIDLFKCVNPQIRGFQLDHSAATIEGKDYINLPRSLTYFPIKVTNADIPYLKDLPRGLTTFPMPAQDSDVWTAEDVAALPPCLKSVHLNELVPEMLPKMPPLASSLSVKRGLFANASKATYPSFQHIVLGQARFSKDEDIMAFSNMTHFSWNAWKPDMSISALEFLPVGLISLQLEMGLAFSVPRLECLSRLINLQRLLLSAHGNIISVNSDLLRFLPKSLQELGTYIYGDVLQDHLLELPPNLRSLTITCNTGYFLRPSDLSRTTLTNDAVQLLPRNLRHLTLPKCPFITMWSMDHWPKGLHHLQFGLTCPDWWQRRQR